MSTAEAINTDLISKFFDALILDQDGADVVPQLYPIRDSGRLLITDGRICFDFPDQDVPKYRVLDGDGWKFFPEPNFKPFVGDYREAFKNVDFTPTHDVPVVSMPAGVVNWQWASLVPCDDCDGNGEVHCNYGHRHECGNCYGNGCVMDVIEEAFEPTEVAGVKYGKRLLWLIQQLPNAKLGPIVKDSTTGFVFNGGKGVLRNMRD